MTIRLRDILAVLEELDATIQPIGFYNPRKSPVGVYPDLRIGQCKSRPIFSNFQIEHCGLNEQWHAHFPVVGSPVVNSVLGIYLREGHQIVGFMSLPLQAYFDQAILKAINEFAMVPEFSPREISGADDVAVLLGESPALNRVFIGATNNRDPWDFAEVGCTGETFDIYGVFTAVTSTLETAPGLDGPTKLHLKELSTLWSSQPSLADSYLSGFAFLAKRFVAAVPNSSEVNHELLKSKSASRVSTDWVNPQADCWRENAVLAMANYIANPTEELAREAASWLGGRLWNSWAKFHFPGLQEVDEKFYEYSLIKIDEECAECGELFEFDSDRFCGSCGFQRGVS